MKKNLSLIMAALMAALTVAVIMFTPSANASVSCVRLTGHGNWLCVANSGLYWTDNLYTRQIYWHPAATDQTVMEQYFCQGDREATYGHPSCNGNAPGVPAGTPRWERRVISLAGGCTIYGWDVTYDNPAPPAPAHCALYNGKERSLTATEKRSVLAFWKATQQIGGYW